MLENLVLYFIAVQVKIFWSYSETAINYFIVMLIWVKKNKQFCNQLFWKLLIVKLQNGS